MNDMKIKCKKDFHGLYKQMKKRALAATIAMSVLSCAPALAADPETAAETETVTETATASAAAAETEVEIAAENDFMQEAIEEAVDGITHQHGGPFGAVIVKDGTVVGKGHNMVLKNNDPTCHGEVAAIRDACSNLGTYDLSGCELYTTGEPCPMCLFASMWANIGKIYYGCTIEDNGKIGFRDDSFDELIGNRDQLGDFLTCIDREACLELFDLYENMDRTIY